MVRISPHPTIRGAYQLQTQQWLARPLSEVFAFFADAHRLQDLTPKFLNFHVVTPKPVSLSTGARIDYRLRLHGIPIRWQSEIREWDPPYRFVDRQIHGPYRLWNHLHTFSEQAGGTLVGDVVDYDVPGGRIVHWLMVRSDLERIFRYRRQKLADFFGTEGPQTSSSSADCD